MKLRLFAFYFLPLISITFLSLLFYSCGDNDDGPKLTVNIAEETKFDASGGSKQFEIFCDIVWIARVKYEQEGSDNWLKLNNTRGKGKNKLTIVADPNTTTDTRTASLVITAEDNKELNQTLVFSQAGADPVLTVSTNAITLLAIPKSTVFRIESNTEWEITIDTNWLKTQKVKGKGDESIVLSADDNTGGERKATISVKLSNHQLSRELQVVQKSIDTYLYRMPMTEWGTSMTETKAYMNGYTQISENATLLVFNGKHKEVSNIYYFDENKLVRAAVLLTPSSTTNEAVASHINYYGYASISGDSYYKSQDGNTAISITTDQDNDLLSVCYYDYKHLFLQPYYGWKKTVNTVKTQMAMSGYVLMGEEKTLSGNNILGYYGRRLEQLSLYRINSNNMLYEIDMYFDPNLVSVDDACNYLTNHFSYSPFEGYEMTVDGIKSRNIFKSHNMYNESEENIAVVFGPHNNYNVVSFMPKDYFLSLVQDSRQTRSDGIIRFPINMLDSELINKLTHKSKKSTQ